MRINYKGKIKSLAILIFSFLNFLILPSSCNDYLDVDAPSKSTVDFVFSMKSEVERALNGVYAQALVNDLYGNAYQSTFVLNSDVDINISDSRNHSHSSYRRFDCDDQGGEILKYWTAAYNLIEYCNKFITYAEASPIYYVTDNDGVYELDEQGNKIADSQMLQWIGEAKCLRAMAYHDLVVMFGDVPFTFVPTDLRGTETIPVADREEIQKALIKDLQQAATGMSSAASTTVERCSKEFAQGLVARIALTAGGYSLRPNKNDAHSYGTMQRPDNWQEYYRTAMQYADSVITSGTHRLNQSYQDVFVSECNYQVINNDDPIFEIPFAKEASGNTGYVQGPSYASYEGKTVGPWGKCGGNMHVNAFYRFLFREGDLRREFVNGLWYFNYFTKENALADTVYFRNDYYCHNNKWSKLWTSEGSALGDITEGGTGINYPYMRYADILLMYAETANELNGGPTEKAVQCLQTVHQRAFTEGDPDFITVAQASKEAFHKAVMDERKWEFAGENSRWRDLVRTNTYAEELIYSFLRYYAVGMNCASGFEDDIIAHDCQDGEDYLSSLPGMRVYYHPYNINEGDEGQQAYAHRMYRKQFYGYTLDASGNILQQYPNQSFQSLRIYNAYKPAGSAPTTSQIKRGGYAAEAWIPVDMYNWFNENTGLPQDKCKYTFYGYIRCDDNGNLWVVRDGALTQPANMLDASELPPVRYILPYPNAVLQRSAGIYKNYYGY